MKRFIISAALFTFVLSLNAQGNSTAEAQSAIVYALPKTELSVDVEIEKTTLKPGVYYQYSERYLATNQVILENKVSYRIKDITVKWHSIPDVRRTYSLMPDKKSNLRLITVNAQGLLCGINVPVTEKQQKINPTKSFVAETPTENKLLPLGEEYLMAGSTAKLAEGVAKQIYRIRESKMSLLTGDLEHLPADGASLNTMLRELNKMEKELTELFVGKTTVEVLKHSINVVPDSATNSKVIFRFSALKGLVPADDLSGNPYYISLIPDKSIVPVSEQRITKSQSALYTVLPANTAVTIGDGVKTLYNTKILIPQLGPVVPFALDLFSEPTSKVYVEAQTGRLLRIEK